MVQLTEDEGIVHSLELGGDARPMATHLTAALSRACEAAPRLLPHRIMQPRRWSRSRLPPQVTFLAVRRRSPPPHPLSSFANWPKDWYPIVAPSLRSASLHPFTHTQPPRTADIACTHTRKDRTLPRRKDPVTGQAAVTMEPEGKAPDTVSSIPRRAPRPARTTLCST
jgi:hypothetical protein